MSRTVRNRREAYDDIQVGGGAGIITTRERTISGSLPPTDSFKDNISVGNATGAERIIQKTTALLAGEKLG